MWLADSPQLLALSGYAQFSSWSDPSSEDGQPRPTSEQDCGPKAQRPVPQTLLSGSLKGLPPAPQLCSFPALSTRVSQLQTLCTPNSISGSSLESPTSQIDYPMKARILDIAGIMNPF